nr:hypothetical protein I308_00490 [Cryptococcus tetragattii IND107]
MSQGSSGPLQACATGASPSILMLPQPQLLTAVLRWRVRGLISLRKLMPLETSMTLSAKEKGRKKI